jgi:hypothetical protein
MMIEFDDETIDEQIQTSTKPFSKGMNTFCALDSRVALPVKDLDDAYETDQYHESHPNGEYPSPDDMFDSQDMEEAASAHRNTARTEYDEFGSIEDIAVPGMQSPLTIFFGDD